MAEKGYRNPVEQLEAVVKARRFMGVCLMEAHRFKEALQQHLEALDVCNNTPQLEEERTYALCNIGVTRLEQAERLSDEDVKKRVLNDSIKYLDESIVAANRMSDVPSHSSGSSSRRREWLKCNMVVDAYNNIGLAYDVLSEPKQAIESLNKALEMHSATFGRDDAYLARRSDMPSEERQECLERRSKLYSAIGLGIMHMHQGDLSTAEGYLRADVSISSSLKFSKDYGKAYINLGNVLMRKREFAKALEEYRLAVSVSSQFKDSDVQALANEKAANAKRAILLDKTAQSGLGRPTLPVVVRVFCVCVSAR